ncbi:hypothetical protein [Macrococcoides canis]|uniref:hypothetical protein n=1 Tax=Macrococcoides canis TaxID=1855823 RepID=UPI00165D3FBB|nr:hypothetical protein [Macrococcus canis]QNR07798.1 hypothetical protein GL258_05845 [Macrococcus canis]
MEEKERLLEGLSKYENQFPARVTFNLYIDKEDKKTIIFRFLKNKKKQLKNVRFDEATFFMHDFSIAPVLHVGDYENAEQVADKILSLQRWL